MKASEIVDKFKNVLLNTEIENDDKITEVSDVEVNEEIALNEQNENSEVQKNVELNEEVEAGYHDRKKWVSTKTKRWKNTKIRCLSTQPKKI